MLCAGPDPASAGPALPRGRGLRRMQPQGSPRHYSKIVTVDDIVVTLWCDLTRLRVRWLLTMHHPTRPRMSQRGCMRDTHTFLQRVCM